MWYKVYYGNDGITVLDFYESRNKPMTIIWFNRKRFIDFSLLRRFCPLELFVYQFVSIRSKSSNDFIYKPLNFVKTCKIAVFDLLSLQVFFKIDSLCK